MATPDSDSDSLGSFGAELEAELLRQQESPPAEGDDGGSAKRRKLSHGSPHGEAPQDAPVPPPVEDATTQKLCPPHPGFLGGICIRCGAHRRRDSEEEDGEDGEQQHVSLSYLSAGLEVRAEVVSQLRSDELRRVLAQRKLLLILDLDHTLLNSARTTDLDAPSAAGLHAMLDAQAAGTDPPELYNLAAVRLWTKLRPGARALITGMSSLCEVLVYTMGDRSYAGHMAQLLDPGGKLLRPGRLISAGDSTVAGVKDLDVVLGDSRGVLVVDDTRAVWARHGANVIVPDRYHFFPSSASSFGDRGDTSWLARGGDEDLSTGQLATIARVITSVHAAFFDAEAQKPGSGDVRTCLASLRRGVLAGCVLLFSGVIPVSSSYPPTEHAVWRSAVELGAAVVSDTSEAVTHVIIQRSGTDKHRWALAQPQVACVTPAWLAACASRWARAPEDDYAMAPP